jgi:hypothetical protein
MKNPGVRVSRVWALVVASVALACVAGAVAAVLPVSSRAAGGSLVGLIAYTRDDGPGSFSSSHTGAAWVATVEGADSRRVTGAGDRVSEIAWAPDGRTLALDIDAGPTTRVNLEIFVVRPDGSVWVPETPARRSRRSSIRERRLTR